MITVYILKLNNWKHYTGITNNLARRINEHQSGHCKSTRRYLPITIVHTEKHSDRKKARKQEVRIKRIGAGKYLKKIKMQQLHNT